MTRTPRDDQKAGFLAAFAQCGVVRRAAKIVGIARQTHARWMKEDPEYPARFRQAKREAAERLEIEARRRAIKGLKRKKFTKGGDPIIDPETGEQYYELEFSDTLLIFLLKGALPHKYRDRVQSEISGPRGGPVSIRAEQLTDDDLAVIAARGGAGVALPASGATGDAGVHDVHQPGLPGQLPPPGSV